MKIFLLLLVFLYFTKLAFSDCFFENSVCFLTLEKEKVKEILGLRTEEVSNSLTNKSVISKIKEIIGLKAKETSELAVYKEVVSQIKENYSIDLDNDIKQINLYLLPGHLNFYLVIDGSFDTKKIQNNIKDAIESKKWRYHKFEDFYLSGNNFQALGINGYNLVFYDKNTLIFCKDSAGDNDSIEISKIPDSIKNLGNISKNYLWISKDIQKTPDIGLEKSNYCIGYVKDNQLIVEAGFNDSLEAKKVIENYKNIPKQQIETLNRNIKSYLEKAKEESSNLSEGLIPNILFNLLESVYSNKTNDLTSNIKILQSENKIIISCDYEIVLSGILTYASTFALRNIISSIEFARGRSQSDDCIFSIERMNYSEPSKIHYANYLQKQIDELKGKLKNSSIADILYFTAMYYIHSKAKKILDSIDISSENDKDKDCLKTKFDTIYITRAAICIYLSTIKNTDDDGKNNDFATEVDENEKIRCFFIQRVVMGAIEMYDLDNDKEPMTFLDIPLLVKGKYLQERDMPNKDCELYLVGNLTENGYIACKTHGSCYLESLKSS